MPTTLSVTPESVSFDALNDTTQLAAEVQDQNGRPITTSVTWISSDSDVVTVDTTGLVTATGNGSATVTATVASLSDVVDANVEQIPVTLRLSPQELRFAERGDTIRIKAETLDANEVPTPGPDSIRWESTRPDVISVDATGLARAESRGDAVITAWADSLTPVSVDASAHWESWAIDLITHRARWRGAYLKTWAALSPYAFTRPSGGGYRIHHHCAIGETLEFIEFRIDRPHGRRFEGSVHTTDEYGDVWFVSRIPIEWAEPVPTQDTVTVRQSASFWGAAWLQEESVPAFTEKLVLDRQRITVHFPLPGGEVRATYIGGWTADEIIQEARRRCAETP